MNNVPSNIITVDNFGVAALGYSQEFDDDMKEKGYEDPFWRRQQIGQQALNNLNENMSTDIREWLVKKPKSTSTEDTIRAVLTPGKKYISATDYAQQREEYIIRHLYAEFGMTDKLIDRIKFMDMEYLIDELKPCMAGDGQCSMFCPDFPCSLTEE